MAAAQTDKTNSIRVVGLKTFVAELKATGPAFPRELSKAHRDIAKTIRDDAQALARSEGSTAAHVAPSIRASGTQKAASILLGEGHPEALGAEFGSIRFRQFKPWRGNSTDAGYFLYPTIRAHEDDIIREFSAAVERITARAFPE